MISFHQLHRFVLLLLLLLFFKELLVLSSSLLTFSYLLILLVEITIQVFDSPFVYVHGMLITELGKQRYMCENVLFTIFILLFCFRKVVAFELYQEAEQN